MHLVHAKSSCTLDVFRSIRNMNASHLVITTVATTGVADTSAWFAESCPCLPDTIQCPSTTANPANHGDHTIHV